MTKEGSMIKLGLAFILVLVGCQSPPVPRQGPLTIRTTASCEERRRDPPNMLVYSASFAVQSMEVESLVSATALLCDVTAFGEGADDVRPCMGSTLCPPSRDALRCMQAPLVEVEGSAEGRAVGRVRVACGRGFEGPNGGDIGYRYETVVLTLTRDSAPDVPE